MPLSITDRYKAHVANLRALDTACNHIYRALKDCLARSQETSAEVLLKTFVLLIGAWSEVRLLKMLHEPGAFSDTERKSILEARTKLDQWKQAVEIGFRRRYNVPNAVLSETSLPRTAFHRFRDIEDLIDGDLRPIIEIRNKLAHGQWARTLNNELTEISEPMMKMLNTENALSANFKIKIIEIISKIVNDLLVGNLAFERDFDAHFSLLVQTKRNLHVRDFDDWAGMLRQKFIRGSAAP